jgi:hypothetical protein
MAEDRLEELKNMARRARDVQAELSDLSDRTTQLSIELKTLTEDKMPDLMTTMGLDKIGVAREGNLPGVDFKLSTRIAASIATTWPEAKRRAAFDFLKAWEAEDLIKTEVKAALPKGHMELAKKLLKAAEELGIAADLTESVHHSTLSAWLRELYAEGSSLSEEQLAIIGGFVGPIVKPVERKE